jgi:hypothetical protein
MRSERLFNQHSAMAALILDVAYDMLDAKTEFLLYMGA